MHGVCRTTRFPSAGPCLTLCLRSDRVASGLSGWRRLTMLLARYRQTPRSVSCFICRLLVSHVASVHHVSDILLLHNCSWYLLLKLSSRHWPVWCTGLMMSCLFRFKFKLCLHQIHFGRCPAYLAELVSSSAENCHRPGLRSTSSSVYSKPRLRTKFAERAFSFSGPAEWNCLPSDLTL